MEQNLVFEVMKKDQPIAKIELHKNTGEVTKTLFSDYFLDISQVDSIVDVSGLNDWFESRCFLRSRADKDILLEGLGLKEYNPFHIVKISRGAMFEDHYWIRFEGEEHLVWDDVNPREIGDLRGR